MKKVAAKAKDLSISLKVGFGVKPIVKQFDIVETATSAGSFNVIIYKFIDSPPAQILICTN